MNPKLWNQLFSLYFVSYMMAVYGQINQGPPSAQQGSISVVVIPATVSIVALPALSTTVTIAPGVSVVTIGNALTSTTISGLSSRTVTVGSDFTNDGDSDTSLTSARHTRTTTINTTILTTPNATTQTISVVTQQRSSTSLESLTTTPDTPSTDSPRDSTSISGIPPAQTSNASSTNAHEPSSSLMPLLVGILIPITAVGSTLLWCCIRNRKTKKMKEDNNVNPSPREVPRTRNAPLRPSMTATTGIWDTEGRLKLGAFVPANVQALARSSPEYFPRSPLHFVPSSPASDTLTSSSPTSNFPPLPPSSPPRPPRPVSLTPSILEAMRRTFSPGGPEGNREDVDSVGPLTAGRTPYSGTPPSISRHHSPNYSRPITYRPQPPPGQARPPVFSDQTEAPMPLHIVKHSPSGPSILDEVAFNPQPSRPRQGGTADFNDAGRQRFQDSDESNEEEKQKKRAETFGALEGALESEGPEFSQRHQYPVSSVYSTDTYGQPLTRPGLNREIPRDRGERGRYEVKRPQRQVDSPDWSGLKGNFI
ncbi:uncharacterized protein BP5553_09495 [Venustampulla echinocandica]|uniref:Transmembrane protein n=1 Tax=Venustampulla echinocandica TaxID=2656787 RepID=A0A370TCV8_9HELO|nr:uncharacterized protein BP5553_09495 [Venustampulla echinocandica]RDL32093.1 hypothetical protein BP5553_09495 [Venustampulla echinocandica]